MKKSVHFIQRLNPYIALALLAVLIAIVEPLKLIGLFIFGKGHWITGSFVMLFAYGRGETFQNCEAKIDALHWFATLWKWLMSVRQKTSQWWQLRYEKSRNSRRSLRLNRP